MDYYNVYFIGDFKYLKELGYKFGKYYARNYIAYSKDKFIIWKASKDVQYDRLGRHFVDMFKYILDIGGIENLQLYESNHTLNNGWKLDGYKFYFNSQTNEFTQNDIEYYKHMKYVYANINEATSDELNLWTNFYIPKEDIDELQKLMPYLEYRKIKEK